MTNLKPSSQVLTNDNQYTIPKINVIDRRLLQLRIVNHMV